MTTCISSLYQYYSFLFRAPVANACKHICAHLLTNLSQLGAFSFGDAIFTHMAYFWN